MSKTTDAAREAARQKYLAALRDLALNLPADDARAIADVYTRQRVIGLARITGTGLHRDGVATTLAVAREAARILQLRRDSANEKGFNVGTENICLRRDETGWFAATRRVGGKWKRTGKEVL